MSELTIAEINRIREVAECRVNSGGRIALKLKLIDINDIDDDDTDSETVKGKQAIVKFLAMKKLDNEKIFYHNLSKTFLLGDRVILQAIDYINRNYYEVDDFQKEVYHVRTIFYSSSKSCDKEETIKKSFCSFLNLTQKDIQRKDYRKAFCRLLSWVNWCRYQPNRPLFPLALGIDNNGYFVPNSEEFYFYDLKPTWHIDVVLRGKDRTIFLKNGSIESVFEPFDLGSLSERRKLQEIFCQILMELGSLDDAVEVATEYPGLVSSSDLVKKIDEAIGIRQRTAAETLLNILLTYEPGHPDLLRFQRELARLDKITKLQTSSNLDIAAVDQMSGTEFEQLIASQFERLSFKVETTPATGDYGADLIVVTPNETRVSVQCKRFKSKVNLKAVQEVVASLSHYLCDYGVVITNSDFLSSARKLAENNEIELWDQDRLINFLSGDLGFSELGSL